MTEYEELIHRLRTVYEADELTNHNVLLEAADAIENLKRENERWEEAMKTALDFIPCWIPIQNGQDMNWTKKQLSIPLSSLMTDRTC